eukprot:1407861-Pleurochrysis_carterae.AAC.2
MNASMAIAQTELQSLRGCARLPVPRVPAAFALRLDVYRNTANKNAGGFQQRVVDTPRFVIGQCAESTTEQCL